jgi:uncharacterized membrane protein (DUF106 family)
MVFGFPGYMEVLLVSMAMSLTSVLISKFATNQSIIKNLKAEMKSLNERIKKAQKAGNTGEMNKLSGDLMKLSGRQMQQNMKPMMISLFFFLAVFWFLGTFYSELIVPSPINIPFIGNQLGWFYWYLIIVLPGSFLFRKLLAVE